MSTLKVRFAPSPTGPFHIGGARSALFNYLLAKQAGGTFLLRVEDTDRARSTRESEENIKEALHWLGIDWNEGVDVGGALGPYRQSERLALYQEVVDELIAKGHAYRCYCTEEELEAERAAQVARKETPRYTGHCAHLDEETRARYEAEGRPHTIRLRVPTDRVYAFHDLVRGPISFESSGVGDFVIVKSDGMPVYNFGVVVDDHFMEVTHVLRGEEHISNTPRQLALYEALGWTPPVFGHISLILGTDRKKMSKRHGATSVEAYRKQGYLPDALNNFLALLGWAPEGEEEIFDREGLIAHFSMDRVAKNPAVFDLDKLNHINFVYLQRLTPEELYALCHPFLVEAGLASETPDAEERARLTLLCTTFQAHMSYGAQIVTESEFLFADGVHDDETHAAEIAEVRAQETYPLVVETFARGLEALEEYTVEHVQVLLKSVMKETKLKGKFVYMPLRVALTGRVHGPDLPNIVVLLGRTACLERLATATRK